MPDTTDPAASALDEIRAVEQAATPGPWEVHTSATIGINLASDETDWPLAQAWMRLEDAQFAAVARISIPRLLAAVEAALKLTEPGSEVHRDLDGNEERGVVRVVRCDVLREAITAALAGEAGDEHR